jgi:hypothetical protein
MANIFAITTANDKIKAENGSATSVFTVTNSTSRPLRGIARIKPLGNTESSWIKIDGEVERDFPPGGTHQFTVTFNKPKSSTPTTPQPAESFPFRLDTVSAANPDEDFSEGPVVTVEIPEQKVEQKKPFPWWILIILGVLLIVGAITAIFLLRDRGNGNPTPTPTPTPAVTRVVYDFIEKAPSAVWKNDLDRVLPLNGPEESTGFVKTIKDALMESGFKEDSVIETHPRWVVNGVITGTYELSEPIDARDRFRAKIGFLKPAVGANIKVRLLLNGTVIAELQKAYDGGLRELDVDLGRYKGEKGKLALQALATPLPYYGWICWVNPRIERVP